MANAVGGVVGAAIGFVVGGPAGAQWGWAIGAAVGTSFSTIRQPRIGELAEVRAGEGGPRARVYGRFRPIGGNVVWAGRAREIRRRQRQGKGAPRVETSTILRSYAIGICEGPITGVSRIWRNNELVYDVRAGSTMLAESARWMQGRTLLTGGWDQLPHPTIEAEAGIDNAPAMRGTALLVVTDEDLTELRGAVPAYQFEVFRGVGRSLTTPPYEIETAEQINVSATLLDGELRTLLHDYQAPPEQLNVSAALMGGSLGVLLRDYQAPPEQLDVSATLHAGELRAILITYNNWPAEQLDVSATLHAGELRAIFITYNNWPAEQINVHATLQDGYLGP